MPKQRKPAAKKDSAIKSVPAEKVLRQSATSKRRARLPIIKARKPGTLDVTNEQIYDLIRFP